MCLICVEYHFKRMTKEEMQRALPEMILFAKNDEERAHFEKLSIKGNLASDELLKKIEDIDNEVKNFINKSPHKKEN